MKDLNIIWNGKTFTVAATKYVENDNTCLVLLGKNDTIEAKPTVNITNLPPHLVYIKAWSENRGIAEVLVSRGYIRPTGKSLHVGAQKVKQYVIEPDFGAAIGITIPPEDMEAPAVDITRDQAIENLMTPQPPAEPKSLDIPGELNVPELVEGLEASGLKVHIIDENTNFDDLPDLQQEKLEEDARDIVMEQDAARDFEESRDIAEAEAEAAAETDNATLPPDIPPSVEK